MIVLGLVVSIIREQLKGFYEEVHHISVKSEYFGAFLVLKSVAELRLPTIRVSVAFVCKCSCRSACVS